MANPGRYKQLNSLTVLVVVVSDGIRIYDQPTRAAPQTPDDQLLLVSVLKNEIYLADMKPLFRDELTAQAVLDTFNLVKLDARMLNESKSWRRIVMPDGGLALGKTLTHSSPKHPYRHIPITACIRSNGLYLYRKSLGRQSPPNASDMFLKISPRHIEPNLLMELFPIMVAAEITAAFRFNRRGLMRVLHRPVAVEPLFKREEN